MAPCTNCIVAVGASVLDPADMHATTRPPTAQEPLGFVSVCSPEESPYLAP